MDTTVEYKNMEPAELIEFATECMFFWANNLSFFKCPRNTVEALQTLNQSIEVAKAAAKKGEVFTETIIQTLDWFALNKDKLVYKEQ